MVWDQHRQPAEDRQKDVVQIYRIILFNQKEWYPVLCGNMDEPGGRSIEWNKCSIKRWIVTVLTYMQKLQSDITEMQSPGTPKPVRVEGWEKVEEKRGVGGWREEGLLFNSTGQSWLAKSKWLNREQRGGCTSLVQRKKASGGTRYPSHHDLITHCTCVVKRQTVSPTCV